MQQRGIKVVALGLDSLPAIKSAGVDVAGGGPFVTTWPPAQSPEAADFTAKFLAQRKVLPSNFLEPDERSQRRGAGRRPVRLTGRLVARRVCLHRLGFHRVGRAIRSLRFSKKALSRSAASGVAARLAAFANAATGSSNRIERAIPIADAPSIDSAELTDKGSVNQRAVLHNRGAALEALYSEAPAANTIMAKCPPSKLGAL